MEALQKSGWRLSSSWTPASTNPKDVLAEALNADLKDIGGASLADLVNAANESGQRTFSVPAGGIVLQISKIRNVAAPKVNEESGAAARMLKLSLTDGQTILHGVEVERIDKLSMATPPGTKIRLRADSHIPYVNGFLQLTPPSLEVLGGHVEALVDKWEISRKLALFTRAKPNNDGGGPPPWIPFGKKIVQTVAVDKNFRALGGDKQQEKDASKETAEFDSQRQDAIDEAAKQGGKKVFGGGKAEIKEAGNRRQQRDGDSSARRSTAPSNFNQDDGEESSRGGRRKGRGRGRNDGDDEAYHAKPTSGVSLFDFLEKEFPGAHDAEEVGGEKGKKFNEPHNDSSRRREDDYSRRREDIKLNSQKGSGYHDGGRGEVRRQQSDHQRRNDREGRNERGSRGGNFNRGERYQTEGGKGQLGENNQRYRDQNRRENNHSQRGSHFQQNEEENNRRRGEGRRGGGGGVGGERGKERRGGTGERRGGERGGGSGFSGGGGERGRNSKLTSSSDRDFGEWSNSTYHDSAAQLRPTSQQQRPQQQHDTVSQPRPQQRSQHDADAISSGFEGMRMSEVDQRRQQQKYQDQNRAPRNQNQHVNGGTARQDHEQSRSSHQKFTKPLPQQFQKSNATQWKEGTTCLAKYWEDGQYYSSRITALTASTAVVLFLEFGNHEEVLLTDLMPLSSQGGRSGGPFIATTPGLPPAFPQS